MIKCNQCGEYNNAPDVFEELPDPNAPGLGIKLSVCPDCGSTDIVNAIICPTSGCYQLMPDTQHRCDKCEASLRTDVRDAVKDLITAYAPRCPSLRNELIEDIAEIFDEVINDPWENKHEK